MCTIQAEDNHLPGTRTLTQILLKILAQLTEKDSTPLVIQARLARSLPGMMRFNPRQNSSMTSTLLRKMILIVN